MIIKKIEPVYICIILIFLLQPINSFSQEIKKGEIEKIKQELIDLRGQQILKYEKLEKLILEIQTKLKNKEEKDELQKLLDEAKNLKSQTREENINVSKKFHSGVRKQQGLNPNISLGGDFFAAYSTSDNEYITEPGDFSYGNNSFHLRETEVALVAPLDPFTRGKAFFSLTKNGISIEEAYMELLNLPLRMNLKAGIFYSEFGPLNRYHDHALPQFDRPRALVNYFSNLGLGGAGIAGNFMLPTILFSDASTLDLSVVNGGNGISFTNEGRRRFLYIGHLKNYYDISENSYFEYSLNGVTGKNDVNGLFNSYISSLGLTYKWVPIGRSRYKSFDWRTEIFYGVYEKADENIMSKGFYTSVQNRINARFWISARLGYSELPYDNSQSDWDFTACVDFWQSEFVFFRLQYQYNSREMFNVIGFPSTIIPNDHSVTLQVCWAMGPHKHEAY